MKNFNFFEKLWEHSRTLKRVGLVLVMCLMAIPQLWGYNRIQLRSDYYTGGWSYTSGWFTFGDDGKKYWDVYHTGADSYWRINIEHYATDYGPSTDGYVMYQTGNKYKVDEKNSQKAFKTTGDAGILRIYTNQKDDGGSDEYPKVWVIRPSVEFKYPWNGGSDWTLVTANDNHDGTYTYRGTYRGVDRFNAGPNGADKIAPEGTGEGTTVIIGSPTTGRRCEFKWQPGTGDPNTDYKYTGGEEDNRGRFTITKLCTITYYANGGTGDAPDPQEVLYGADQTLRGNTGSLAKTDYVFVGWNTESDGSGEHYDVGATLEDVEADVDLYAEWVSGKWGVKGKGGDGALGSDFETFHVLRKISTNKYKGSVSLGAHQVYEFKITDNTTWYGKSDIYKYFLGQTNTVNLETGGGSEKNCIIATGNAGEYVFEFDETAGSLSITYPNGNNHPSTNFVYYSNPKSWGTIKAYIYDSPELTKWENSPILGTPVTIGGKTYYYTALGDRKDVIFHNGSGSQTSDIDEADDEVGHYYNTSWAQFTVRITLNNQSATSAGTEYKEVKFNYDELTTSIICPTKTGYNFGGYYTETNGGGVQIIDANGAWIASVPGYTDGSKKWIKDGGAATLYAKWTEKTWSVNAVVSPDGAGYASPSDAATFGEVVGGAISASEKEGYDFYKWKVTSGSGTFTSATSANTTFKPTEASTVTAQFCPETGSGETVFKFDVSTTSGNVCSSTGTSTINESNFSTLEGGYVDAYVTGTSQLVYATGGYIRVSGSTNPYLILNLDCPLKEGDIIKWYSAASSSRNLYFRHTSYNTATGQITLQVPTSAASQMTRITDAFDDVSTIYITVSGQPLDIKSIEIIRPYSITLDANTNGGTVNGEETIEVTADGFTYFPRAVKSGYRFKGWYTASSGGTLATEPYLSTDGATLYAQFEDCPASGTMFSLGSMSSSTAKKVPACSDASKPNYMDLRPYATIVGGAAYSGNNHKSNEKGGVTNSNQINIDGENAFVRVDLDCALAEGDKISVSAGADLCVTTSYPRATTYTITKSTDFVCPAAFEDATSVYIWKKSADTQITGITITRPAPVSTFDVTIASSNTDYGDVDETSIADVESGATITTSDNELTIGETVITATPETSDAQYTYTFTGWTKSDGTALPSTVTADLAVRANFTSTPVSYTLTWDVNGGEAGSCSGCTTGTVAYGTILVAPGNPTRDGYDFAGWSPTPAATMPATNTTYTATWTATTTAITLNANTSNHGMGDNTSATATYDATSLTSVTHTTPAAGYQLDGYYTTASGEGTKIINADGSFVAATTDYTTSTGKWKYTTSTATLYARYVLMDACYELTPATSGSAPGDYEVIAGTSDGGIMEKIGGTLNYGAGGLNFESGSSSKVSVALENNMKTGTVIMLEMISEKDGNRGLKVATSGGTSKAELNLSTQGTETKTYTVVADDGLAGTNVFQLHRNNDIRLKSIKVVNCGSSATTYTVSNTLSHITKSSGATSALAGGNYTAVFTDDTGYDLPSTITVTIGGSTKTAGKDYYWTQATGKLVIPGKNVTGNISISITGVAECTTAGLAYAVTEVNKTYGDAAFTNTLTNANSAVRYSSTTSAVATVNTTTGQVTIAGVGSTTIKATIADDATYCDEEVSYTLNVAKAPIGVTATTGAATNVTQTSARLPINLSGTTANAASVTVKLYSSSDALIDTYASIATNATYTEVTGLTASTTYKYTITVIGDANHLDGVETAKQSFTTADPTYSITFAANGSDGGSAMTNVTDIVSGNDVDLAANTWTKTEHDFVGWKTNVALTYVPNGGGDEVDVAVDGIVPDEATIQNVTSNITLTAQWHAKVYNVYFIVGEGGRAIDGYTSYEYGEQKAMPTNVIRTGYLFEGWYDNSEYTGDPLTQMPADATGDKFYYAKWHELSSKCLYITRDVITAYNAVAAAPGYYMYNDAKYVFGSGYDASASMLVLEAADGRSYVYLDPNIGEVKQVEVHISAIADSNVEGKGISWGFVNDDDDVATVDLTDMDQITSHAFTFRPTDENKQYFVFKSLATTLSIDNICVFYEPETYSVTYSKGEGATGTVPATATYNYNDVVTVEAGTDLAKDGYTFRGWFDGTTFYVIGDKFKVTHNTTLNAVWQSDSGCEGRSVGSLFKMQVKTGLTNGTLVNDDGNFCSLTTSNYLSTLKGGTAKAQNENKHTTITGTNAIALTDNDSYIEISLPSAIQAGDVLIYTGASGIEVGNASTKPSPVQLSIASGTNVTAVVGAGNDLIGYSKIYIYRQSSSSTVQYFEVRRPVFYMSVGTPDAYSFPLGETAITTSNGLDVLVGGGAKAGCLTAGHMQLRGSSYYDLLFYSYSNGYLKLDLDNELAQGDVISFTHNVGANPQLAITMTNSWNGTIATSSKTYTIPAKSPLIGAETIYLWGASSTSYAKTLSIIRAADAVSGGGEAICHFTVSFACKTGFEALDGRLPENTVGVPSGAHIGTPEDPFAIGYAFLGWYDDAACSDGHEVDFETLTITENTTIYAKWENNVHTFVGGTASHVDEWEEDGNWEDESVPNSAYPYCYSQIYVKAPAKIAKDTKAHVGRLDIVNNGSSYTGQLTIASGAMLIVYDKVSRITNWSTKERLATIAEDIYIGSERDDAAYSWREEGALNGALIMGDYDRETQADSATVQFATQSYTKSGDGSWGEREVNQYIGIPFVQANVSDYKPYEKYKYAQVYLLEHDRPNRSWLQMSEDQDMYEFVGYDIICYSFAPDAYTSPKPIFDLKGELASTDEERRIHLREYQGYYGADYNENILANSWTAPIDIASFEVSDFENAEATIYMFNAGTQAEYDDNMEWASNYSTYPGQYTAIPINDLKLRPYDYVGYKTIPSMQSFSVITLDNDGNSLTYHDLSYLTMDYKRLVYNPAVEAVGVTTETMHAPRRVPTMEEEPLAIMLHVHGMSGMGDRIRILEREDFSYGRDNGWETSKLLGIIEAPSLYAVTEVGDQATVAVPDVEGLGLTFQAGEYDNVYTFNFEYDENEEPLYLLDKKTGIYTRVLTENTYSFVTTDKNFNERFLLTRNYQMPEVATGLENINADSSLNERVQKVLINDMIYILRDGHIYDATGKMLK